MQLTDRSGIGECIPACAELWEATPSAEHQLTWLWSLGGGCTDKLISPILDRQASDLGFFNEQWRKTGPLEESPTYLLAISDKWFFGSSSLHWLSRKPNNELRVGIQQLNGKQEVTGIATLCWIQLLQIPISMWNVGTKKFWISMFNVYIPTEIKNDIDSSEG